MGTQNEIYNYTGQQNLTFFVPQTSTGELSSTFYAEFRYIYIERENFSIMQGFKDTKKFKCAK
jgi:hypothetical protein